MQLSGDATDFNRPTETIRIILFFLNFYMVTEVFDQPLDGWGAAWVIVSSAGWSAGVPIWLHAPIGKVAGRIRAGGRQL